MSLKKTLALAGLGGLTSRGVNFISILIIVPQVLGSIGASGYAIYAIALSLATFAVIGDLGLGSALVNTIASSDVDESLRAVVSRAWWSVVALSAAICSIGLCIILTDYWLPAPLRVPVRASVLAVCSLAVGAPGAIYQRAAFARNLPLVYNGTSIAGRVLAVFAIILCTKLKLTVEWFVVATLFVPSLISTATMVLLWLTIFHGIKPELPTRSGFAKKKEIALGISFLCMQFASFAETGLDATIITAFIGLSAVPDYDITLKMFFYGPVLVGLIAYPLWPMIARSASCNDLGALEKLKRSAYLRTLSFSVIIYILLVAAHESIFRMWLHRESKSSTIFLVTLSIYETLLSISLFQASFLQALGKIRPQFLSLMLLVAGAFLIKIASAALGSTTGMIAGLAALYPIRFYYLERIIKKSIQSE